MRWSVTVAQTLTVVYGDARALIRCKNVTTATATLKAAHCVHTLVVTQTAAWGLTLINVQAVWRFVVAVSFSVKAIPRIACADNSSKVISALLLARWCSTHIHTFRYALAHHKPEPFTAFPPEASAILPIGPNAGIFHRQDFIIGTLHSWGVHCKRRPDGAGTRFPEENDTDSAKW